MPQLPLPVQRNGTGATEIQNLPTYFAVDAAHTWYHDMTGADLASCKGTFLSHCNRLFTLRHRNSPTCAAALYFRDSNKVGKVCQTIIRPYHVFVDNAEDLGGGRILLSNPHNRVSLICPKSVSKTLPVNSISIVQVPCGCSLQSDTIYLPSSLQACSNTDTTSKVWHPINTLALAELSRLALKDPDQDYVDTDQSYEINIFFFFFFFFLLD